MVLQAKKSNVVSNSVISVENGGDLNDVYLAGISEKRKIHLRVYEEGFAGLAKESHPIDKLWMKDSGKDYAIVNTRSSKEIQNRFSSSKRKRYQKKVKGLIQNLVPGDERNVLAHGNYSIEVIISDDSSLINAEQSREELYLPFAYKNDGEISGGNFMYVWEAGVQDQLKGKRDSLTDKPVKEFFTGGCLFGTSLYGVDQFGHVHSLTSPNYKLPSHILIESIYSPFDVHPDEILTRDSLVNALNFIKAAGDNSVEVSYHLPLSNYILYGLNSYFAGNMTLNALIDYIKIVKQRVDLQREFLDQVSQRFNVRIRAGSTLDCFRFNDMTPETLLSEFLDNLNLSAKGLEEFDQEHKTKFKEKIFYNCLNVLSEQKGIIGRVWSHISDKVYSGELKIDLANILNLNYLDYSANLAVSSANYGDREVASLLPANESPVNHFYRKLFAEEFGAILCFQWLPPLQVHDDDFRQRVFYLSEFVEDVNSLLKQKLLPHLFKQTAAQALNSESLKRECSQKINEILALHQEFILLKSKRRKFRFQSDDSENKTLQESSA